MRPDRPPTPHIPPDPAPRRQAPIPEHLVDAFFDHELDEGSRERLFRDMLADLDHAEEMARTQHALCLLREPVETPDFTDRVMARVDERRRFLPRRLRRTVTAGRLAVAACLLLGVLAIAVTRRMAPQAFDLAPRERPLTAVIDAGRDAAVAGTQDLAGAVSAVGERAAPVVELSRRVLGEAEAGPAGRERYISAALTPGRLPGVRTLPPARAETLIVFGGAGTVSAAPLPDPHELARFAGARFPVASVVRLEGGRWAGPGADRLRLFLSPGLEPVRAGLPDSPVLVEKVAEDRSGGASPQK